MKWLSPCKVKAYYNTPALNESILPIIFTARKGAGGMKMEGFFPLQRIGEAQNRGGGREIFKNRSVKAQKLRRERFLKRGRIEMIVVPNSEGKEN